MRGTLPFLTSLFSGLIMMSGLAQDSLVRVVAEPGDGVYSLLRKHGADPAEAMEEFIALNEPQLDGGLALAEGATYLLPVAASDTVLVMPDISGVDISGDTNKETDREPKAGSAGEPKAETPFARFDIFGEQYAEIRPVSNRLDGSVYYLVSGHGGPDPGAMTKYGDKLISEDEYAYDVTLRLARNLLGHGATVYIIIRDPDDGIRDDRLLEMDTDEVAYPEDAIPLNQVARLKQRVDAVNALYRKHAGQHQRLIVTHVDSRSKGQNIDVFFYHHHKSRSGRKLAESIHKTFQEKYAQFQPNRRYEGTFEDRSALYIVKNTLPATAFIEIGNIRNTRDQRRILDPDNRQALANWIAEGVLLDFEDR